MSLPWIEKYKPTTLDEKEVVTLLDKDYLLIKTLQELVGAIHRLTSVLAR